jgi:hypothetical protein
LRARSEPHASGRRSGDQFTVYICDRFVVPTLTTQQQQQIGNGQVRLDQMAKQFIHDHLDYRCAVLVDGAQALALEREIRARALPAGKPFPNPLRDPLGGRRGRC